MDSQVDFRAPKDPYKLVYIIFYWLGIGSLLPWNFFIAVNEYWMFKFRDTTRNETLDSEDDDVHKGNSTGYELSPLQLKWASYLSIASMIPNVFFLLLNAVYGHRFKTQPRLLAALIIVIVLFIFSDIMTKTDTDSWQDAFLTVTLVSVVIINVMVAIFQGGLSGVAGKFPPSYMGSVVQGQALGGIFAAATNVVMLALGADNINAAFYDFLIAIIFLASALVAFVVLTRTEFFKYYTDGHIKPPVIDIESDSEDSEEITTITAASTQASFPSMSATSTEASLPTTETDDLLMAPSSVVNPQIVSMSGPTGDNAKVEITEPPTRQHHHHKSNLLHIFARIWIWILAVFVCFLVTLAVFPAITVLVRSTSYGQGNAWGDIYFIPVGCFLVFNIGDYMGRILASVVQWPKATNFGSLFILGLSLVRLAFIPLFLFCNASPENRSVTQVHFYSDTAYLVLMVLFSISNGYIGSICMMFAPKMLSTGPEQGQAASLMVSCLVLGLAVGAALSGFCVQLL